jgi:hypothetical protein
VWVDRGERYEHVVVGSGDRRDLLVRDGRTARDRFGVDAEDDGGDVALAVVGGDVVRRRQARAAKVVCGGGAPLRP